MFGKPVAFALVALAAPLSGIACSQAPEESAAASAAEQKRGQRSVELAPELCAPRPDGFSLSSDNRYFPFEADQAWVFEGDADGELVRVEIRVLDQVELVARVMTRVIEEREWADGELVEVSRNFVAQAADGTVCYFGEDVDDYEDGEIVSHEGAWRAGEGGNMPGILMPAAPRPGMKFAMEIAPGVAEDQGTVVGSGPVRVPAGAFRDTVRIREHNPLENETGFKIYAAGVGLVIDEELELVRY